MPEPKPASEGNNGFNWPPPFEYPYAVVILSQPLTFSDEPKRKEKKKRHSHTLADKREAILLIESALEIETTLVDAIRKVSAKNGVEVLTMDKWYRDRVRLKNLYASEKLKKNPKDRATRRKRIFSKPRSPMFPQTEITLANEIRASLALGKRYQLCIFLSDT